MTDLKGRYFISYRRSPARLKGDKEGELMSDALRDRGISTWRDLDDLGSDPTEEQLSLILNAPSLAGAVMLVSKEVNTSEMIKNVEIHQILKRHQANDGFVLHIVAIGIDYGEVTEIFNQQTRLQDLSRFNIIKVSQNELTSEGAICVANKISKNRIRLIKNNGKDSERPWTIGIYSRSASKANDLDLCIDFSRYFKDRSTIISNYQTMLRASTDVAKSLATESSNSKIVCRGLASLPIGILFGAVFSKFRFDLTWIQEFRGAESQRLYLSLKDSGLVLSVRSSRGSPSSHDIVLAVSVSADIESAVTDYLNRQNLKPRATLAISLENGPSKAGQSLSANDCLTIARRAIDEIRELKDNLGLKLMNVHIFLSAPLGIAVFLGHQLNTVSNCYLYEHRPDSNPVYEQVLCFQPSNFNYN